MSNAPNMAMAVPFAWTPDGSYDLRLAFASGPSPVDVTVDAGTYRMNLAPTAGTVRDFLRRLETRINAALTGAGRATTATVELTDRGLVTVLLSGAATWTLTTTLRDTLGMSGTSFTGVTAIAGTEPPRDLYLLAGGDSQGWQRREPIAAGVTMAGVGYGVRSGVVTERAEYVFEFIPTDVEQRAAAEEVWTPWEAGTSTLPWSFARFFSTALSASVAFARHWQDARTSTSERYDLVTVDPRDLASPRVVQQFPSWTAYRAWTVGLVRTSTATRA